MAEMNFERLSDDIYACVSDEHRFGTDAFILEHFASPKSKDTVCDLGTGCGIIPLLMCKKHKPKKIVGIDIQPEAIELFRKGVNKSKIEPEIIPLCVDLCDYKTDQLFDLVTCNPPYFSCGAGFERRIEAQRMARHENLCTIKDICATSAKLLKFGGRFCACYRPERLVDLICAMRDAGLEPKRVRMAAKNSKTPPWLVLVEAKKGSKPFMTVEPMLEAYDGDGFSKEMMSIYDWEGYN